MKRKKRGERKNPHDLTHFCLPSGRLSSSPALLEGGRSQKGKKRKEGDLLLNQIPRGSSPPQEKGKRKKKEISRDDWVGLLRPLMTRERRGAKGKRKGGRGGEGVPVSSPGAPLEGRTREKGGKGKKKGKSQHRPYRSMLTTFTISRSISLHWRSYI